MTEIEVFADITCPFAHVGLRRIAGQVAGSGAAGFDLRVRAWPLEVVNGTPFTGEGLRPKVEALRRDVAPDLFAGFDPSSFPRSSLPALAAEHAAYRLGAGRGLGFSLAIRNALFEHGADISDVEVLRRLAEEHEVPPADSADALAVEADHRDGVERGVVGSPHFFTPSGDFFCPTLDIDHDDGGYTITFDQAGFDSFLTAALS